MRVLFTYLTIYADKRGRHAQESNRGLAGDAHFRRHPEDILEFLLGASEVLSVPKDSYFFHENERAETLYVLEAGEVAVLKLWNGQQNVLRQLQKGDCFGEMALMDLFPRSASIRAVTPCTAIQLSTASFHKIYEMDLEQFALIQMNIGREISRRPRVADEQLFRVMMGEPDIDPAILFPST